MEFYLGDRAPPAPSAC